MKRTNLPASKSGQWNMEIRNYRPEDCRQLARLFYETVHAVNKRDYTREQLDVWATGKVDLEKWNASFLSHHTVVAEGNGSILGFGDMDNSGYLDRLYVHKDWQHRGIGGRICDYLESCVGSPCYTTHASITAVPFFESRGYTVVKARQVERGGIWLKNYMMQKTP